LDSKPIFAGLSALPFQAGLPQPSLTNARKWPFYGSMKIIEYKTATAESWSLLDKEVNKMLSQGYQLYGSPYLGENQVDGAVTLTLAQAMVKCGLRENPVPLETLPETLIAP
jgi:hypothetical protein